MIGDEEENERAGDIVLDMVEPANKALSLMPQYDGFERGCQGRQAVFQVPSTTPSGPNHCKIRLVVSFLDAKGLPSGLSSLLVVS